MQRIARRALVLRVRSAMVRWWASCTLLWVLSPFPADAALSSTTTTTLYPFTCELPEHYSTAHLQKVGFRNCAFVIQANASYGKAIADGKELSSEQKQDWLARGKYAMQLCDEAIWELVRDDTVEAGARKAINAWGSVIMNQLECCTVLNAPFCIDQDWSTATVAIIVPILMLLLLLCGSLTARSMKKKDLPLPMHDTSRDLMHMKPVGVFGSRLPFDSLKSELKNLWLQKSCLRVLADAPAFAEASASLFSALHEAFDFQKDNVRNQYEHLLSLWRSQCAMVADRSVAEREKVNEDVLLKEALGDLHTELLNGFYIWRSKFRSYGKAEMSPGGDLPNLGGAAWAAETLQGVNAGAPDSSGADVKVQLAEIATFLLVWGEAGNLRFMPEVIYAITEFALVSDSFDLKELYNIADRSERHSSLFLSRVVRPVYGVIFNEWYEYVVVNKSTQKDVKKLREGFDAFLPASVSNYDDWNEFFSDPKALVANLLLRNGEKLFDLPHSRRFAALSSVDWSVSLEAAVTKTHRELHSLWGVFATCHRVILLHALLFGVGICLMAGEPNETPDGEQPIGGQTVFVRFAAVGILVPSHVILRNFARWQVSGPAVRKKYSWIPLLDTYRNVRAGFRRWFQSFREPRCACGGLLMKGLLTEPPALFWMLVFVTYALVRAHDADASGEGDNLQLMLLVHYVLSAYGFFHLLLRPTDRYTQFSMSHVPLASRAVRYLFWFLVLAFKFTLGLTIFHSLHETIDALQIVRLGYESPTELSQVFYSTNWVTGVIIWAVLWGTSFMLFLSDTQLWFTVGCTFLGVAVAFMQRRCRCCSFCFQDALAQIPERFAEKVLPYSRAKDTDKGTAHVSESFTVVWDRIIEYMRYEDKISNQELDDLSFKVAPAGTQFTCSWEELKRPLGKITDRGGAKGSSTDMSNPPEGAASRAARARMPMLFTPKGFVENCVRDYFCSDPRSLKNPDVQWRLLALSRGLELPIPRPYRAPYFPGITVLIPHYGETILMGKEELYSGREDIVPLMDWLRTKYGDEFTHFTNRMQARPEGWAVSGNLWEQYEDVQWTKITSWGSMRMQTLWRTVGGMCLYHPAIQAHYEVQADQRSKLAAPDVWDPSDCFTCMVSMQMYKFFDNKNLVQTNQMFQKYPSCLKIAYIDCEDKGPTAELDGVHTQQKRRYYSCLIDHGCKTDPATHRRAPRLRLELPGYPILGDGKGDNQNHAIPFMRGHFSQCIDANQGAYFEQMMMLPCALAEFRSHKRGDGLAKRIIGFPEHITSDIGSIGDFAASAEVAFGTILQRTYAALGARMHYGHPDIMNKLYMIQQGGVSKATKTINLSEDIFAGMDFTLRGDGRQIRHCEYFHLAKGRDLGFNTVLGFFSKLSSGTGEQVLTRQTFRLEQAMHLPEALAFYYAHAGYYFTQFLVSWSLPLLIFIWLLVLLSDCEGYFDAFQHCPDTSAAGFVRTPSAEAMADLLSIAFSWLMIFLIVATSMPLFAEMWMERSFAVALSRMVKTLCTCSPLLFIFQAKVIGHYVMNEFRWGGATYVATGRGLPTERRPFVGELTDKGLKVGGLYLDYAVIAYYDGAMLLAGAILVWVAGGHSNAGDGATGKLMFMFISIALTCASWLYAPFVFNPYQFVLRHWRSDLRALRLFFLQDSGKHWVEWYDTTQLKPRTGGFHQSVVDISFFLGVIFFAAWYSTLNMRVTSLVAIYTKFRWIGNGYFVVSLLPPFFCSLIYCYLVVFFERMVGCSGIVLRRLEAFSRHMRKRDRKKPDEEPGAEEDDTEVRAHATAEDRITPELEAATPPGEAEANPFWQRVRTRMGCRLGVPLPFSAVMVLVLDCVETGAALAPFYWVNWMNTFYAGLVLKWGLTTMMVYFGEGILRSRRYQERCCFCIGFPLQLWVRAHRMMRDILVSSLIFWVLTPCVFLNTMNDYLCPFCNVHHMLIYRDPGHQRRKDVLVSTAPLTLSMRRSADQSSAPEEPASAQGDNPIRAFFGSLFTWQTAEGGSSAAASPTVVGKPEA